MGKIDGVGEFMYTYSVIIPHKNSCDKVIRLVNSIPRRKDIEIFIVDDNSEQEIFAKLKTAVSDFNLDMRNVTLLKSNSKYAGEARNEGLRYSNSEWTIFADADDYFLCDAFKYFDKYIESNFDVVFFKVKSTKYSGDTEVPGNRGEVFNNLVADVLKQNNAETQYRLRYKYLVPWGKLIKSSLIKKNKIFFDGSKVANDVMFSTKLSSHAKTIKVDDAYVYCVTEGMDNLSKLRSIQDLEIRNDKFIEQFEYIKKIDSNQSVESIMKAKGMLGSSLKHGGILFFLREIKKFRKKNIRIF
ncbi:glycosyltransferase family A protein [Vagococcus silagei]|uniref:Glycosyltransferase n=1 Tax=Vagococcus silagei TaxID=2508885 RepID=A0A4S3AZI8_9ENTE|nr:glycosyltransferase family 2 protein [Vagococcus silagei]THB60161.1 glycosyltransferase [Vagococcus silagei]